MKNNYKTHSTKTIQLLEMLLQVNSSIGKF